MRTISNTMYQIALECLEAEFKKKHQKFESRITFGLVKDNFSDYNIKMGVNWSALGTMDSQETAEFAQALSCASKLAEDFVFNGYKRVFENAGELFNGKIDDVEKVYKKLLEGAKYNNCTDIYKKAYDYKINQYNEIIDDYITTLGRDAEGRYMLLSRMKMDCEYFLGNGNRHEKFLWAGNVKNHIEYMKALHNSFKEEDKPEWLSMDDILDYEKRMN